MRRALPFLLIAITAGTASAEATGSVRGTVSFAGPPPPRAALGRSSDPRCGTAERLAEEVVVTAGKLAGVLVKIKVGTAGAHPAPAEPVVITQADCMYTPRVVGVIAGQKLAIRNADPTFHNVRGARGPRTIWNLAQPANDPDIIRTNLGQPGDVVSLHCDVHPWMQAWVAVVDHPFFAVTGADGTFELKGVPAGSYLLEAWHPALGTQRASIKVKAKKPTSATFRF